MPLAYIYWVDTGARPEHPIAPGGPPPGIWPSPGHPAHPIAPGGPPPGIWPSPGYPAHPIAPGGPPPGIWGPTDPRPGWGLPEGPQQPPGIWGPTDPRPTPPIVIPPPNNPPTLPPVGSVPEGTMLVLVKTAEGLKWATVAPTPPYNPPSGGAVPAPVAKPA